MPERPFMSFHPFHVTPSTLMHSAMAYLSPASQCYDRIVRLHSRRTLRVSSRACTTILALHPEILLLIRSYLHVVLTDQLYMRTKSALQEYESSLCALLCPDCRSYNEDVFGSSVWSWEGFSGPCSCDLIGRDTSMIQTSKLSTSLSTPPPPPLPKQFTDRQHWMEVHLAREYHHLFPHVLPTATAATATTSNLPSPGIWDVVDHVLHEHGCALMRDPPLSALRNIPGVLVRLRTLGLPSLPFLDHHQTNNYHHRAPPVGSLAVVVARGTTGALSEGDDDDGLACTRQTAILSRARRELALDHELDVEEHSPTTAASRRRRFALGILDPKLAGSTVLSPSPAPASLSLPPPPSFSRLPNHASALLLRFLQVVTACIMMPVAFLITVVCFYCTPGTLRLL